MLYYCVLYGVLNTTKRFHRSFDSRLEIFVLVLIQIIEHITTPTSKDTAHTDTGELFISRRMRLFSDRQPGLSRLSRRSGILGWRHW